MQKYTNTIVGRYSNRLPVGTHSITRNGATSSVTPQSNESPTVSLHGGPTGFDQAAFEPVPLDALAPSSGGSVTASSPPGALFTPAELNTLQTQLPQGSSALFRHVSQDGDQGFPGTLIVEVIVGLLPPQAPSTSTGEYHLGSIVFIYRAKLADDGPKVVTPINLTQVSVEHIWQEVPIQNLRIAVALGIQPRCIAQGGPGTSVNQRPQPDHQGERLFVKRKSRYHLPLHVAGGAHR